VNSTKSNKEIAKGLSSFISKVLRGISAKEMEDLLSSSLGCSDKDWNMISLNRQLDFWWGQAKFALRCQGIDLSSVDESKSKIRLQFHWMAAHRGDPSQPIGLDEPTVRDMLLSMREYGTGPISAANAISNRPVLSGHCFEIEMESSKAKKMKYMVDLQWALIRISAMSGAAESPELLQDPNDPDSDHQIRIQQWIELQNFREEMALGERSD
jgi:hypothetical protein